MADNVGLKIGVEGEKEFKSALKDINQSFKVLASEMNLVSSQFNKNEKSVEALTARNKVLNREIDEQTNKVKNLETALESAQNSLRRAFGAQRQTEHHHGDRPAERIGQRHSYRRRCEHRLRHALPIVQILR